MDLISLAIFIVVVVAVFAVVSWFVRSSGLTIPQPLMIVIYAILAIVAIIVLARIAGVGRIW